MTSIVPTSTEARITEAKVDIVRPLVNIDEAVKAFNEYQKLKQKLAGPGDFIKFKDKEGNIKEAPTKQWRSKLTRFFGISVEIVDEKVETLPDGSFVVKVTAKATAPNGLYMYGDGSCWSKTKEGRGDLYHNTRSHAVTRAKNRAVLELVGFGEVSAEEISEAEVLDVTPTTANGKDKKELATEAQRKKIYTLASKLGFSSDNMHAIMKERYNKESSKELTKEEASDLIEFLTEIEQKAQESKKEENENERA